MTAAAAGEPGEQEPGSIREALGSVKSAIQFLAGVDMTQLPGECIGELLTVMERVDAGQAAVRGKAVTVLADQHLYHEYGQRTATSFLVYATRVKRGKAAQVARLGSLYRQHPLLADALAEQDVVSESIAVQIAAWTGQLPEDCIPAADGILVEGCRAGLTEAQLADLAAQIRAQACGPDPDTDGALPDRGLRVETTLDGAGRIDGDLTPGCTALLQAVLTAFGEKTGPGDLRTPHERNHDALEEALKRVLAGKRGKPYKAVIHIPFADLCTLPGASAMLAACTSQVAGVMAARDAARAAAARARDAHGAWAGHRAADLVTGGGDGGTWLAGDRAVALLPDAIIVPVVTTRLAAEHLEMIITLGAEIHRLAAEQAASEDPTTTPAAGAWSAADAAADAAERAVRAARITDLRRQLAGEAMALVTGPDAVASWLRQALLGAPGTGPLALALAGKSLPLDVGRARTIPAQIRLAAGIRSPHCQAPGCTQPASGCEAHHLIHREHGGPTSLANCDTWCWWHHNILIHRNGWTARLNPDGTPILRRPDGTTLPNGPPTWPG
ncbi:MAG TPA: hypothetical protein VN969_01655 [Streptosporangiaceae bacterium]|nr:hypothetical protein [Streptosporangiaceae bacterium]